MPPFFFLERVTVLFEHSGCLQCGHTAFMLTILKKERVLFIDRKPTRIGAKQMAPIITRCLSRLSRWVGLAREVMRAEFPEFESIQAFKVLSLRDKHESTWRVLSERLEEQMKSLAKLGHMLGLNVSILTEQFFSALPTAQYIFSKKDCEAGAAWREAVNTIDRGNRLAGDKTGAIRTVLLRAAAWGVSTSGVERPFGLLREAQP